MKARGRHGPSLESITADLFDEASLLAKARPVIVRKELPSPPLGIARPPIKRLWYAVVFPDLEELQAACRLQSLSLHAQRFTSLVSIEMPNALLLEVKGSVKLFGSLTELQARIDATWSRFSLRAQSATAPTTLAALWFARAGKHVCMDDPGQLASEIAELPMACTSWHPDRLQTLRSMGVMRMGELLRLPRAGVARRLSPAAVLELDIALARQAAPRRAFVPCERFHERRDFETEIANVVYLQKALAPLLERCARFLRERQAGVQTLELKLRHRTLPATCLHLRWASVTSERHRLEAVMDERLHRLELVAPVRGVKLLSGALQPLSAGSLDAFAGLRGSGGDTIPQLVERLRARLGDAAVYGVVSVPEHRPEAAWQRVHELPSASAVHGAGAVDGGSSGRLVNGRADMPRPIWLLAEPLRLSAECQPLPLGSLILEEGPERIESGWWDGKDVVRDYYNARQSYGARRFQGAKWWVFQDRQTHAWYLHGIFA